MPNMLQRRYPFYIVMRYIWGSVGVVAMFSEDKRRLNAVGTRIDAMSREFEHQGAAHAADREAVVDAMLQQLAPGFPGRAKGVIARNIEIFKLTIRRMIARIDKGF
jgi:hypothetical protein